MVHPKKRGEEEKEEEEEEEKEEGDNEKVASIRSGDLRRSSVLSQLMRNLKYSQQKSDGLSKMNVTKKKKLPPTTTIPTKPITTEQPL